MSHPIKYLICLSVVAVFAGTSSGQTFQSYFTGDAKDTITMANGGICLMGGASEDDEAMRWFLEQANGGDVLVLRASGSDGYNAYFFSELGVALNSVETIVFQNATASQEAYIHQRIRQAEAIWFAGGDQWKYVSYWRNSPIDSLINQAIRERNIVIGGTSAGMAILGQFYFTAERGTIRSEGALANPFDSRVTLSNEPFLDLDILQSVITDTHFDDPDRKGRLVTFMSRIYEEHQLSARAIACDEYTAVCIAPDGTASVFGGYPEHEDYAYFVQVNCQHQNGGPETLEPAVALTWRQGGNALKAYRVAGTSTGNHTFDLLNWQSGNGGTWWNWQVDAGIFSETQGSALNCSPLSTTDTKSNLAFEIYPNPTSGLLEIKSPKDHWLGNSILLIDVSGRKHPLSGIKQSPTRWTFDVSELPKGLYYITLATRSKHTRTLRFVKQ